MLRTVTCRTCVDPGDATECSSTRVRDARAAAPSMSAAISISNVLSRVLTLFLVLVIVDCEMAEAAVSDHGTYQTSIPVQVPEFHRITPSIRLNYDSRAGNGALGVGWSLQAGSQITRASRLNGVPRYDATDQLWLDGMELLPCGAAVRSISCSSGGTHTTRVEGVTRIRHDTVTNTWTLWRRDGTRYLYSPRFRDVSSLTDTLRWVLTEVTDTHGNGVTYGYVCGAGSYCYISDISYGQGLVCAASQPSGGPDAPAHSLGSPLPGASIHFYWEGRPDPQSVAIGGALQETSWRLRAIDVQEGAQRVRVYQINYLPAPGASGYTDRRSSIKSIQLFGTDAVVDLRGNVTSGTGMPPNTFEAPAFVSAPKPSFVDTVAGGDEFLPSVPVQYMLPQIYPGRTVQRFPPSRVIFRTYRPREPFVERSNTSSVTLGDFDGDRKLDFMHWNTDGICAQLQTRTMLAAWSPTALPVDEQHAVPAANDCLTTSFPADLDGDGRTDVLFLRYKRVEPFNNRNQTYEAQIISALSNGDGTFSLRAPAVVWTSINYATILISRCGVGDFNGDGLADLTCTVKESGRWVIHQAISTSSGRFRVTSDLQANTLTDSHALAIADANGDGLSDLIVVDRRGAVGAPLVTIKTGASLGQSFLWRSQTTSITGVGQKETLRILTGEFNGDGRADFAIVIADDAGVGGSITTFTSDAGVTSRYRVNRSSVSGEMPNVSIGDHNGDRLDDLIFAVRRRAGTCPSTSGSETQGLTASFSDGSGRFLIPQRFDTTCYGDTGLPWIGDRIHDAGAAYVNGDHIADLFQHFEVLRELPVPSTEAFSQPCTGDPSARCVWQEAFQLVDRSTYAAEDAWRWHAVDINGDGRPDWLYISYGNPGLSVVSLITQVDGTRQRVQQDIPSSGVNNPASGVTAGDLARVDLLSHILLADVGGGPGGAPDGRVDIILVDDLTQQIVTLLSNADGTWRKRVTPYGFTPTTELRGHVKPVSHGDVNGWRALDVNGDGLTDLVHIAFRDTGATTRSSIRLRVTTLAALGDGTWSAPVGSDYDFRGNFRNPNVRGFHPADINGDGRMDLVAVESDPSLLLGNNANVYTLISRGNGDWEDVDSPVALPSQASIQWRSADMNGDGRTDLVQVRTQSGQLYISSMLSLGNGRWHPVSNVQVSPPLAFDTQAAADFRMTDLDGDGKQDVVRITKTAAGQAATTVIWNHYPNFDQATTPGLAVGTENNSGWNIVDLGGDGLAELVQLARQGAPTIDVVHLPVSQARMTLSRNGMGAQDEISYRALAEADRTMPLGSLPQVVAAVASRAENTGTVAIVEYSFSRATYSYTKRRFLGFAHVEQADGARIAAADLELTDACGARRSTTELFDVSRNLIERTRSLFAAPTLTPEASGSSPSGATPEYALCRTDVVQREEWEGSGQPRKSEGRMTFDNYGNVRELIQTGDVSDPLDDRRTESQVYANVNDFVVDRLAWQAMSGMKSGQWHRFAETQYEYDQSGDYRKAPRSRAELTRVRRQGQPPSKFVDTTYQYDKKGNVSVVTGPPIPSNPNGIAVILTHDCEFARFPERVCDPLHCTTAIWNKRLGLLKSKTDANGQTTSYEYDVQGRITQQTHPDGSAQRWKWPGNAQWGSRNQGFTRELTDGSPDDGVLWEATYFDGLGRPTRVEREGGMIQEVLAYDGLSQRVISSSAPRFRWDATAAITTRDYDAAGRLKFIRNPDSSVSRVTHGVGSKTVADELGAKTVYEVDAFDRIVAVNEARRDCFDESCGVVETAITRYTYDALDRLLTITDAYQNQTTTEWDSLGRPRRSCDPDRGCTKFTWNDDATLASEEDANGDTDRLYYDVKGRPKLRESLDQAQHTTREIRWSWDKDPVTGAAIGASLGHITQVDDVSAAARLRSSYEYDGMGRIALDTECIDLKCYSMRTAFDLAGRVRRITYPGLNGSITATSPSVGYIYGNDGRLASIPGYIVKISRHASGGAREIIFSNGVTETRSRDERRGWTDGVAVLSPTSWLFGQKVVRNVAGRVRQEEIDYSRRGGHLDDYAHDDRGRLKKVTSTDPSRNVSFAYDMIGNFTDHSQLGKIYYKDAKHVHAVTDTGSGENYSYDLVGQMVSSNTLNIRWNAGHRPAAIDTATGSIQYAYNSNGIRVKTTAGGSVTLQPHPEVEVDGNGRFTFSVFAEGGRLIRFERPNDPTFLHKDVLGSTRVVTNMQGRMLDEHDYGVTGAQTRSTQQSSNLFTYIGAQRDARTDLLYLNARYYDPRLAHFISPDPLVSDVYNPQTLNRYSYALNDPVTLKDPSGYCVPYSEFASDLDCREPRTPLLPSFPRETYIDSPNHPNPNLGGRGFAYEVDPIAGTHGGPSVVFIPNKPDPNATAAFDRSFALGMMQLNVLLNKTYDFGAGSDLGPQMHAADSPYLATNDIFLQQTKRTFTNDVLVEALLFVAGEKALQLAGSLVFVKPYTTRQGFEWGFQNAQMGHELVLGKFPGNVEYAARTPGAVTLNVPAQKYSLMYNAGVVRGFLEAGGKIRFTSQTFTGTFGLEARQVLGIPGAP